MKIKLLDLFKGLDIGVDMFCWMTVGLEISNPRNDDKAGLEIWKENAKKLPHGLGYLVKEAKKKELNLEFGLNPKW
jgi:alpha-galactosidase